MNAPKKPAKKPAKPKLETRIKRWYQGDQDEDDGAELLAEWWEKQLKKKPQCQGKRNRDKGQEAEREVLSRLPMFPGAKRGLQFRGGSEVADGGDNLPFHLEVKNCKTLQLPEWWRQAEADKAEAKDDRPIVIAYKVQGTSKYRVEMELEEFVRLQRGFNRLYLHRESDSSWEVAEDDEPLGLILKEANGFSVVTYGSQKNAPNPKHPDGLWPTLDAAEAAVRRVSEETK